VSKIGIIGASGFTGAELLRLCAAHPDLEIGFATGDTQAGTPVADLYPGLAAAAVPERYVAWEPALLDGVDLVFCGLPHGASQALMGTLVDGVDHVVDLGADFRLSDPALYPQWYGAEHTCPDLLERFAYGLPELFREEVTAARHVAVPGCYPTAAALALAPMVRAGLVEAKGIIVDAASGVSGAGRLPRENTTFCAVDENFAAYGLLSHRHTPEIEQVLGASVLFTPHLAPMNRGILATCYARPSSRLDTDGALAYLADWYGREPFVVVSDRPPSTKATLGANTAHLTARVDERTGHLIVLAAIDNLVKGASGQAVQCANLLLGLPETTGLPTTGVTP
jgi:N-acetyl-gamma-glutamyl-phosphate reductase